MGTTKLMYTTVYYIIYIAWKTSYFCCQHSGSKAEHAADSWASFLYIM